MYTLLSLHLVSNEPSHGLHKGLHLAEQLLVHGLVHRPRTPAAHQPAPHHTNANGQQDHQAFEHVEIVVGGLAGIALVAHVARGADALARGRAARGVRAAVGHSHLQPLKTFKRDFAQGEFGARTWGRHAVQQ